jgi:hypothetical protein
MDFKISMIALNMELAERVSLIKREIVSVTDLDVAHAEAVAAYDEARQILTSRVSRQQDEIIELKKALIILEDYTVDTLVS